MRTKLIKLLEPYNKLTPLVKLSMWGSFASLLSLLLSVVLGFNEPNNKAHLEGEMSKIKAAVILVESRCLSGTEYGVSADVDGNITIKSFKPKGSGSITLNIRELKGATAFQEALRIIGDKNVRECTQNFFRDILYPVFKSYPQPVGAKIEHDSTSKAKFLGYVPDEVEIHDFIEGETRLYYRFSVKQPASVRIRFAKNSQILNMKLVTIKENLIAHGNYRSEQGTEEHFLIPGDYYVIVKCYDKRRATAFRMRIIAVV